MSTPFDPLLDACPNALCPRDPDAGLRHAMPLFVALLSAPIHDKGRHRAGFRIGYRID